MLGEESCKQNRRILVTGGDGFLGRYVVDEFTKCLSTNPFIVSHREYDLTNIGQIKELFDVSRPQVVVHLAAVVGGIGANLQEPGRFFYENAIMGLQLMHEAYLRGVEKFVTIGTVCSYPKYAGIPFKEKDIWNGYPEQSNAPYGLAKRMLLVQAQAYREQYGFNSIYLIPVNLYGPGDKNDLALSHVIPAIIRKCLEARKYQKKEIRVWGSGESTREFLFVADAAKAIVKATRVYDKPEPINIGSGEEVSIQKLVELIKQLTGFNGLVVWDRNKPEGQSRRLVDSRLATKWLGHAPKVSLRDGLSETIAWYQANGI